MLLDPIDVIVFRIFSVTIDDQILTNITAAGDRWHLVYVPSVGTYFEG